MSVVYDIDPDDEMSLYLRDLGRSPEEAFAEYMQTGFYVFAVIREVLKRLERPLSSVASLLDFASGHGRTTRFFLQDLDPARITVADIQPGAVGFQARTFGVEGLVSTANPEAVEIAGHDVVTCVSLFTHLPRELFGRWLHKLASACNPGGVFLFTTHDLRSYDGPEEPGGRDFLFVPESESRSLDVEIYGSTYVTDGFVREAVAALPGGWRIDASLPRSLGGLQTLHVVRPADAEPRRVEEVLLPTCYLDSLAVENGIATFSGWACSTSERAPASSVRAHVDDRRVCEAELGLHRPDVARQLRVPEAAQSGFRGAFPYAGSMSGSVFFLEVIDSRGLPFRIYRRLGQGP